MKCLNCHYDNPVGSKYCGECAKPLHSDTTCLKCHHINPLNQQFCNICATPLPQKMSSTDLPRFARKISLGLNGIKKVLPGWERYVKVICATAIVLLLAAFVTELLKPDVITGDRLEILLVALAVAILIPYISNFEALGVKVSVREEVEKLSAWAKASPYYTLGSEYEEAEDLELAEQYYIKSLNECPTFWPALLGLGSVHQTRAAESDNADEYATSINYYHQVLDLDPDNIYSYNNLAKIYVSGPPLIRDTGKALENANKALDIMPTLYDSVYFKGEALNQIGTPESFQGAYDAYHGILEAGGLPKAVHWVMYGLSIAKSNLGQPVTPEELQEMFDYAQENEEDDRLLKYFKDEEGYFRETDRKIIRDFREDKQREPYIVVVKPTSRTGAI